MCSFYELDNAANPSVDTMSLFYLRNVRQFVGKKPFWRVIPQQFRMADGVVSPN